MSTNENTLEDKILAIGMLGFCVGFGYWTRSGSGVILFYDMGPQVVLLDGLVCIITLCLGILVLIGMILLHFDKKEG